MPFWVGFVIPMIPSYNIKEQKDALFTEFICTHFPSYLEKFEKTLNQSKGPYLFGDKLTIADFHSLGFLLRMPFNDNYEHTEIMKALVGNGKYPKTEAYIKHCKTMFKDYAAYQGRPF